MRSLFLLFLLAGTEAFASYRLFQLKVTHLGTPEREETVLSTMDHYQYFLFHGGSARVKVELVDHWFCPGDTSRRKYCDKPKPAGERAPASLPLNRQPVIP